MTGRTRIKICGVRDVESALVAVECGADALGFVFAPGTAREVTASAALEIAAYLPPFVTKVALFVGAKADRIAAVQDEFPFDVVQLHGDEPEARVKEIRARVGVPVVRAVRYDAQTIANVIHHWNRVGEIDALLVDGSAGGEGRSFDWAGLASVAEHAMHPLVVAGGLRAENVGDAIRAVEPYAVDVSSGVERELGVKDAGLISAFCDAVRRADAALAPGDPG